MITSDKRFSDALWKVKDLAKREETTVIDIEIVEEVRTMIGVS